MHYDVERFATHTAGQDFHTPFEDPRRSAPPAGVEQGDTAMSWSREIHRNTVSDSDSKHQAGFIGGVAIDVIQHDPTKPELVPDHPVTVNLVAECS
jgi:hypothetical protein